MPLSSNEKLVLIMLNDLKRIGLLGCGWLGMALAEQLILKGYGVKGSTTRLDKLDDLKKSGIEAYQINLNAGSVSGDFESFLNELDVLVIIIPPQFNKPKTNLYKGLKFLFKNHDLSFLKNLIYISSTGVFADGRHKTYDENSNPNNESPRGKHLIALEELIKAQNQIQNRSVLRYGGLIKHNGRNPVHFLSGKENISNPEAPVNLIEQKDAVDLLIKIIEKPKHFNIYHGVNPSHPSRINYYIKKAETLSLKPPIFNKTEVSLGKMVQSKVTQDVFNFEYKSGI